MNNRMRGRTQAAAGVTIALAMTITAVSARSAETFKATASVKSPHAAASAPVTISIDRFVSDADRDRIVNVFKANDARAARDTLTAMDDIGFIEAAGQRAAIKYAYARPTAGGRVITAVTAKPLLFIGGSGADAKPKPKEGFDFALAVIVLDAADTGEGELAPAAGVKVDPSGAFVVDEYSREVVHLTGIAKVK
jgi:hypothetical protein